MKTTSRLIFERFGGIVAYRYRDGEHGAYSDQYPELWEQTRSPSEADLRSKLRAMAPDHKRTRPEMDWKATTMQYAQTPEMARERVLRGARASARLTRAKGDANFDAVTDWSANITAIAREAGCSWSQAKAERARRMQVALGTEAAE